MLGCDIGGGVSKDGAYLFGMVISEDCECFERVPPIRLTGILKDLSKITLYCVNWK